MLAALCGSIWQSHLMIKPAGLRKRFLAALLLSQMTKKCRNKSRRWVGMEVLKSYQDLTKRTMPSQEPEEHTAVITGAQPWDFKSKVTISLPGQQAICRISIPSTSAQRRMLSTASRWGTTTKEQWCELSLQVVSNSSWWRFLPWQTWQDINRLLIQIGIFYYFFLHFVAALIFWNGNNFSGSANSRTKNCTHPRSRGKQIKNKILLISQTLKANLLLPISKQCVVTSGVSLEYHACWEK